jgi:hypothetical protein
MTADSGIRKVTIQKTSLPPVNGRNQSYILRYRVVSEDKNRYSHWSPQHIIPVSAVDPVDFSLKIDNSSSTLDLVWEPVQDVTSFDVYKRIDSGDWQFASTVSTTSYKSLFNSSSTSIQLAVQIPTYPKTRSTVATLFVTSETAI